MIYVPGMSRDELMAMGFLAFIAGYDTTASLLSFFVYVMSKHPGIQEKLTKEIDAKFPTVSGLLICFTCIK